LARKCLNGQNGLPVKSGRSYSGCRIFGKILRDIRGLLNRVLYQAAMNMGLPFVFQSRLPDFALNLMYENMIMKATGSLTVFRHRQIPELRSGGFAQPFQVLLHVVIPGLLNTRTP